MWSVIGIHPPKHLFWTLNMAWIPPFMHSLSLTHHAHRPLSKRLMHMAHNSGKTSGKTSCEGVHEFTSRPWRMRTVETRLRQVRLRSHTTHAPWHANVEASVRTENPEDAVFTALCLRSSEVCFVCTHALWSARERACRKCHGGEEKVE